MADDDPFRTLPEWPPSLTALKRDMDRLDGDTDDAVLQHQLDAAVDYVEREHRGVYDFTGLFSDGALPRPHRDMINGTLRLAARLYSRRNSPDAVVGVGDTGTSFVPSFDADIERMLELGRYRGSFTV